MLQNYRHAGALAHEHSIIAARGKSKGKGGLELLDNTWMKDAALIQRARIVLVLFLSRKSKGELVELIMNWLDDSEMCRFCQRYLDKRDLAYIEGRKTR